jgi:DNA-binding NtrC family response regulator
MAHATVLVVDDEDLVRWSLRERFTRDGDTVIEAATAADALAHLSAGLDLIMLDYRLPDGDGLSLLRTIKEMTPDTPVVLMTAFSSVAGAVEAMKLGAYHYLNKPFDLDDVAVVVQQALETGLLRREVRAHRTSRSREFSFDAIVGRSPAMTAIKALLARVARSPASTVLITGETGTGKDLAAKIVHYNSDRERKPFVNITCSALPDQLLESELFGHERGAFTDARQQKSGLLETADGGTVFLDEVGEMTPGLQAKLLRFLEEKTFKRIGGLTDIRVDVRVMAATNRNLEDDVRAGRFREDLFYRLQVMPVHLPPLRERKGDVTLLVDFYLERYNREFHKRVPGVTPEAMVCLEQYRWPGNVRELRNAIERVMLLQADQAPMSARDFAALTRPAAQGLFRLPVEGLRLEDVERQLVVQALDRANGNLTRAGRLLGINRDQVRYRLEKFGLARPQTGEPPRRGPSAPGVGSDRSDVVAG